MPSGRGSSGTAARPSPAFATLRARRAYDVRLLPDRALASIDEAEAFLRDRRLLTLVADSALPSLFGAIHEGPYDASKGGFASWPKTKWSWGGELAARAGVYVLKIHRGKLLYVSRDTAAVVDPLCRDALERASDGELGREAAAIVRHLAAAGPTSVDDLKVELGSEAKTLRSVRERLERVGAVVSTSSIVAGERRGHRHTSVLRRWDQVWTARRKVSPEHALGELIALGVSAAVLTHEDEPRTWFSWPVTRDVIERLVASGKLWRPASGWLAVDRH